MARIPDNFHNFSLRGMARIGVNDKIIMKRRFLLIQNESIRILTLQLMDDSANVYCFGSISEGSTTPGLKSDTDYLIFTQI
jgi:hypothetical protein